MSRLRDTLADAVMERSSYDEYSSCINIANEYISNRTHSELMELHRIISLEYCHLEYNPEFQTFVVIGDDDE